MKFPIIVKNSSIDFILVGTIGQKRGVVAKNDNSNVDLIGEYRIKYQDDKKQTLSFFQNFLNLLGFSYFQNIHFVESDAVNNILNLQDERETSYVFCWKGFCSKKELDTVKKELDKHINSLLSSYKNDDENEFIWNIAPLVFVCSKANETGKVWRSVFIFLLRLFLKILILLFLLSLIIFH